MIPPNATALKMSGARALAILTEAMTAAVNKVNDPKRLSIQETSMGLPASMGTLHVVLIDGKPLEGPLEAVEVAVVHGNYPVHVALIKCLEAFLYPLRRAFGPEVYKVATDVIKDQGRAFVTQAEMGKWITTFVYPDEPQVQHTNPCSECAFNRTIKPGELGGSTPETYIGQMHGPYLVPCHVRHNCGADEARRNPNNAQCAGGAVFRANTGRAAELQAKMPEHIKEKFLWLPDDHENVFSTNAEFLAHHKGISIEEATKQLELTPPDFLLAYELQRPGAKRLENVPKPNLKP